MSGIAIRANKLSKRYKLGSARIMNQTLREAIVSKASAPFRHLFSNGLSVDGGSKRNKDYIWAVRNIDLEVTEGDVVGIIGHNGSGKSTLLKIISRITSPTKGEAEVWGRVGSLLEVGTGFHQELTGRENIYLSGAILGMSRREINDNLDRIIEFSGIAKFLDTPLKFFSTGMHLRLAFAVAAHLETDILLIDEVLAVGDAEFQKKCMQKMVELANQGKTVLFVSHNLPAVSHLCKTGILLDHGTVTARGTIQEVITEYGRLLADSTDRELSADSAKSISVAGIQLASDNRRLFPGTPWCIKFHLIVREPYQHVAIQLGVSTYDGKDLVLDVIDSIKAPSIAKPGGYHAEVKIPPLWLKPQTYAVRIKVHANRDVQHMDRTFSEWLNLHVESQVHNDVRNKAILSPECEWSFGLLEESRG